MITVDVEYANGSHKSTRMIIIRNMPPNAARAAGIAFDVADEPRQWSDGAADLILINHPGLQRLP